ncbi:tetratricopeptide repeat protein [Candidatus Sumerlaeota bacterium]|nr:tetratricopeptide repeat protein [Candidatus Sumerlaeota bacterium]
MPDENKKSSTSPDVARAPFRLSSSAESPLWAIVIIVLLGLLVFGNTTLNGFVYDDCEVVENSQLITTFRNIPILFSRSYFRYTPELSYRPVVTFTYFFDYALFDGVPEGYHLVNVLIHLINAVLVFYILRVLIQIFRPPSPQAKNLISLSGALFFLLHPVVTEPVNLISYREDLLSTCFVLLSLMLYLSALTATTKKPFIYPISWIIFLLALLSKESAITFPFMLLLLEHTFHHSHRHTGHNGLNGPNGQNGPNGLNGQNRLTDKLTTLPFFIILLFYLVLRFFIATPPHKYLVPYFGDSPTRALLNFPRFFAHYLFLILYPLNLSADYTFIPIKTVLHPLIIGGWLVGILYLLGLWYVWKKKQFLLTIGLLWFLCFIIPVSNIYPLANPVADRYLYLPLVGIAMIVSGLIGILLECNALSSAGRGLRKVVISLFLVMLLLYAVRDIKRNTVWRDDATLWTETLRHHPRSPAALKGLGLVYLRQKKFNDAERMLRTAVQINPRDIKTRNNLAVLYAKKGELNKAIAELQRILQYAPGYAAAHYNLARCYASQKPPNVELAIRETKSALRLGYPVPDEFLHHIQSLSLEE